MLRVVYELAVNAFKALSKDPKTQLIILLLFGWGYMLWVKLNTDTQSSNDFVLQQLKEAKVKIEQYEKREYESQARERATIETYNRRIDSISYKFYDFMVQYKILTGKYKL